MSLCVIPVNHYLCKARALLSELLNPLVFHLVGLEHFNYHAAAHLKCKPDWFFHVMP